MDVRPNQSHLFKGKKPINHFAPSKDAAKMNAFLKKNSLPEWG